MTKLIDFNLMSKNFPDKTLYRVFDEQLHVIQANSSVLEMFKDDMDYINEILTTNLHLGFMISKFQITVCEILSALTVLKKSLHKTSQQLRRVQRGTVSATQKNIYLNRVHNAYGTFILELNFIVHETEEMLHREKLSSDTLENMFNEPYRPKSELSNKSSANGRQRSRSGSFVGSQIASFFDWFSENSPSFSSNKYSDDKTVPKFNFIVPIKPSTWTPKRRAHKIGMRQIVPNTDITKDPTDKIDYNPSDVRDTINRQENTYISLPYSANGTLADNRKLNIEYLLDISTNVIGSGLVKDQLEKIRDEIIIPSTPASIPIVDDGVNLNKKAPDCCYYGNTFFMNSPKIIPKKMG